MTKRLYITLLLMLPLMAGAQSVRLTNYKAPTALYFNFEHLFNYNLYEHCRWGAGFTWVTPNEYAANPREFLGQWILQGYTAYGVFDRQWKYGGSAMLRRRGQYDFTFFAGGKHDVEHAATRKMEPYLLTSPDDNAGYLASRFSMANTVYGGISWKPAPRWVGHASLCYSHETPLFDSTGCLYPTDDALPPVCRYLDLNVWFDVNLTANRRQAPESKLTIHLTGGLAEMENAYLRALAQYSWGKAYEDFHLWCQAGYVTPQVAYSRLFDLSGTGGTPYYFNHSFLTVPPLQFTADLFAHLCIRYTAPLPLWELSFSKPKPFLQLNMLWGELIGNDNTCGIALAAPSRGLAEPATGFDGLFRWGFLDMGFAIAYRLTPPLADYQPENPLDSFGFAIVARLIV